MPQARRTWENLAALQPDQVATGGILRKDLAELEKRVGLHYEAIQTLVNELERVWTG